MNDSYMEKKKFSNNNAEDKICENKLKLYLM